MEKSKISAVMAAAAVSLFIAGCASNGAAPTKSADAGSVKIKCYGGNSCKGQAECKTAMNECKGMNSCKGTGFEMMSEAACVDRLGRA